MNGEDNLQFMLMEVAMHPPALNYLLICLFNSGGQTIQEVIVHELHEFSRILST